ncbi:MAG: ABC transporter substrate-binding protein [Okeania sp. SIO2D1]|uniref:ABC transporter substrate-binding protein n=1 Tax=Okeania sp. SIO2C9 TaxID=2607791 RepID=UPI0013B9031B|nr:ABC transporter substrate-binding protein [Okeania sp. SIO2C9]NEQ77224.1 ABC transporter substrate-binding protein [Okeania sp. SIO2C9]NES68531.1 ABC transporter substrate-binding protein [Okeania sp. SIO2D1]
MNYINRRQFIQYSSLAISTSILTSCATPNNSNSTAKNNKNLDTVTYGTNWYAQAEHGGFYQAIATGIYEDYGLEVTIRMGNAQVNGTQLLVGGGIDFFMGSSLEAIRSVEAGIPTITVAAIFQKDPQVLIAHPGVGNDSLEQLKNKPILVSSLAEKGYWQFLKTKFGYQDDQRRPYNSSVVPFLVDKNVIQQGYLTSEPFTIQQKGGFEPVVMLLADAGYKPYATTIETTKEMLEKNPDLVERFVHASIKGWYSYLENPEPANQLIKKDNPEMKDDLLAYSLEKMKKYGIIISGDASTKGIGAMTDERWKLFFDSVVEAEIIKPDTNYQEAFTLQFVNQGVEAYK